MYTHLLSLGWHPKAWRDSTTVIIPKPNKPDYHIPKSYRPIALLPCLSKVIEKIMATRLGFMCERHQLLDNTQIGGRKLRSAIDAVTCLVSDIQKAKREKDDHTSLFLDVKGAFDNVSPGPHPHPYPHGFPHPTHKMGSIFRV